MNSPDKQQLQYLEHLRTTIEQLQITEKSLQKTNANLKDKVNGLQSSSSLVLNEVEVQKRKNTALNVFVAELQRKHDTQFTDLTNISPDADMMTKEKFFLKELLVKKGEQAEQYRAAIQCAKTMLQGTKSLPETKFAEEQSETLVKIASNLVRLRNQDMLCARKWYNVQKENIQLESRLKALKLQLQRQSVTMQELYEDYLQKVNKNNAQLGYVHISLSQLNGVGDERVISEHLIEQVSFMQQERRDVENQRNELRDHYALVIRELQTIKKQNHTLREFFSDRSQQSRLASRMKARVEQLMDLRIECKKGSSEPRILAESKVVESARTYLNRLQQANNYLNQRFLEVVQGTACVDDVIAGKFFSKLLADKDEKLRYEQKMNKQLAERIRQTKKKKDILLADTQRIQQQLEMYSIQRRTSEQSVQNRFKMSSSQSPLNQYTFKRPQQL